MIFELQTLTLNSDFAKTQSVMISTRGLNFRWKTRFSRAIENVDGRCKRQKGVPSTCDPVRKNTAGISAEKHVKIPAEKLQKNLQNLQHEFCV